MKYKMGRGMKYTIISYIRNEATQFALQFAELADQLPTDTEFIVVDGGGDGLDTSTIETVRTTGSGVDFGYELRGDPQSAELLIPSGNATLSGQLSLTLSGLTAVFNLAGTEVSRTYVPEPNTFSLLGIALVGVAGCRWRRGRRSVR